MKHYLAVAWALLRYRVAVMLGLFMLIGLARHTGLDHISVNEVLALIALTFTYISATSFNDLADEAIDKINHAGKRGRLLVTGEASRRDLATVGIAASLLMLILGAAIGWRGFILMIISLAVNIGYSLPPLKLSYRTFLVPFVLAIAYVVVPYGLGVVVAGGRFGRTDGWLLAALYSLFLARINLKDFRDRAGDSAVGKPTLLLKFGKNVTIAASLAALVAGVAFTIVALPTRYGAAAALIYGLVIAWLLLRLYHSKVGPAEQVVIGVAAKVGNGLLLSILLIAITTSSTLTPWLIPVVLGLLLIASLGNLKFLTQDPASVLQSYRG